MITTPAFKDKRYAVLGLARSGMSVVESLLEGGAQVTAWDNREEPRRALMGRVELADPVLADLTGFAGVVVSPGVPLNTHPIAGVAERFGVPVIGDIELFAQARDHLPAHRVVGITGTNGKSTTTALVHHILQSAALPVRMGGNIGIPVLSGNPLSAGGVYVLELSSYQIDLTKTLACEVAVLLNLTPDHLDRYDGFAGYAASKARLFAMQRPDQIAIFGMGDPKTMAIAAREAQLREPANVRSVDGSDLIRMQEDWPTLQGPHNLQNAAVAVATPRRWGLPRRSGARRWPASAACRTGWSGLPKSAGSCSSMTARPPIRPRRRRHLPPFRPVPIPGFTGSWAGCPRATSSTNVPRNSAMSPPPIPSAKPDRVSPSCWPRI
jgi:UDP-N-acetylmuramoylalanine--D-glutamate ligase